LPGAFPAPVANWHSVCPHREMSFRLAEGTEPCVRSPEQRAIRTRGVLASPMLELDPVPSLDRPRSRSERGNNPTDGWEFRWSSRAERSSPGSELIGTRSPGRQSFGSPVSTRPRSGLLREIPRLRTRPQLGASPISSRLHRQRRTDRSLRRPTVHAQVPPQDLATQASALRRVDWKLLQYVRSCGGSSRVSPCERPPATR
jgi:hypothetical protein